MNLFFDECMPAKWCQRLADLLIARRNPLKAQHLLRVLDRGTTDDLLTKWLRDNARDAIVISGDNARNSRGADPRLPDLLPREGIRSVFISPKLCQRDGFEKLRMMIVCLPDIEELFHGPITRHKLQESPGARRYHLTDWPHSSLPPIRNQ